LKEDVDLSLEGYGMTVYPQDVATNFLAKKYGNAGNVKAYTFESTWHVLVYVSITVEYVCGVTGRWQAINTSFESQFHCVIVAFIVNTEQRIRQKLLVQTLKKTSK
jgi:hypothetical protein